MCAVSTVERASITSASSSIRASSCPSPRDKARASPLILLSFTVFDAAMRASARSWVVSGVARASSTRRSASTPARSAADCRRVLAERLLLPVTSSKARCSGASSIGLAAAPTKAPAGPPTTAPSPTPATAATDFAANPGPGSWAPCASRVIRPLLPPHASTPDARHPDSLTMGPLTERPRRPVSLTDDRRGHRDVVGVGSLSSCRHTTIVIMGRPATTMINPLGSRTGWRQVISVAGASQRGDPRHRRGLPGRTGASASSKDGDGDGIGVHYIPPSAS